MKKIKFLTIFLLGSVGIFVLSASNKYTNLTNSNLSVTDTAKVERWQAPASADSITNPNKVTPEFIAKGEELYNMYCFACHGDTGYGDGPAGGAMGVRPANFHDPEVIKQKDGALFWKLTNGKGNMPPFKEVLKDEQRWQLIAYLRELGKKS